MRAPLSSVLANALHFRCPNCRKGPLFANWINKVLPRCPNCGLSYFRESGYYLGGMIITYVFTSFTLLAFYLLSLLLPGFWSGAAILLALLYVRPAYSLWISLDFWIDPWEPERRSA